MKNYLQNILSGEKIGLSIIDKSVVIGDRSGEDITTFLNHPSSLIVPLGKSQDRLSFKAKFLNKKDDIKKFFNRLFHEGEMSRVKIAMQNTSFTGFLESYEITYSNFDNKSNAEFATVYFQFIGIEIEVRGGKPKQANNTNEKASRSVASRAKHKTKDVHYIGIVAGTTDPVNTSFWQRAEDDDKLIIKPVKEQDPSKVANYRNYWTFDFVPALREIIINAIESSKSEDKVVIPMDTSLEWSGRNSVFEREEAGQRFAKRIEEVVSDVGQRYEYEKIHIHLIGHSHGGNVIHEITKKIKLPEKCKIQTIVHLSTPFFKKDLHQLNKEHVAGDAKIVNVFNQFDLTQFAIADFSLRALHDYVQKLMPIKGIVKNIKNNKLLSKPYFKALLSAKSKELTALYQMVNFIDNRYYDLLPDVDPEDFERRLNDLYSSEEFKSDFKKLLEDLIKILDLVIEVTEDISLEVVPKAAKQEILGYLKQSKKTIKKISEEVSSRSVKESIQETIMTLLTFTQNVLTSILKNNDKSISSVGESELVLRIVDVLHPLVTQFNDTSQDFSHATHVIDVTKSDLYYNSLGNTGFDKFKEAVKAAEEKVFADFSNKENVAKLIGLLLVSEPSVIRSIKGISLGWATYFAKVFMPENIKNKYEDIEKSLEKITEFFDQDARKYSIFGRQVNPSEIPATRMDLRGIGPYMTIAPPKEDYESPKAIADETNTGFRENPGLGYFAIFSHSVSRHFMQPKLKELLEEQLK